MLKLVGENLMRNVVSKSIPTKYLVTSKGKRVTLQWRKLADTILTVGFRLTSVILGHANQCASF